MEWISRPLADESAVHTLVQEGRNLHPALARVLVLRGINTPSKAQHFFRDRLTDLTDPFLMYGMVAGARRLARAIKRRERVMIFGDYDADGVTATALLTTYLRKWGVPTQYFIPNRFQDGYGLCKRGVDAAVDYGAALLVVVDCGIRNIDEGAYAKDKGLDTIICDHHLPKHDGTLPDVVAVIDPHIPEDPSPFKHFSACGLAFKLAQATTVLLDEDPGDLNDLLDLVALSTVADMMPLHQENRVLVAEGLSRLRTTKRLGLRALAGLVNRVRLEAVNADDVSWQLAPRLNAAGRMDDASLAVDLLLATDPAKARSLARRLDALNKTRRATAAELTQQARPQARVQISGEHDGILVLHGPDWHPGVVGIAAGQIAREFMRPTLVLSLQDGVAGGSARSFGGIDLFEALSGCSDLLVRFGGHASAAGLAVEEHNILTLRQRLSAFVKARLKPEDLVLREEYDVEVSLSELDARFKKVLQLLEPYGQGNKEPKFMARDITADRLKLLKDKHLKGTVRQADSPRSPHHQMIAFNKPDDFSALQRGALFDMIFSVRENYFNGVTTDELHVHQLRLSQQAAP